MQSCLVAFIFSVNQKARSSADRGTGCVFRAQTGGQGSPSLRPTIGTTPNRSSRASCLGGLGL